MVFIFLCQSCKQVSKTREGKQSSSHDEGTDDVGLFRGKVQGGCSTRECAWYGSFSCCGSRRVGTVSLAFPSSTIVLSCEPTICMEIDQSLRFTRMRDFV